MSKHRYVVLTDEQRQRLNHLIRAGSEKARTLTRARILLLADRAVGISRTDQQIAEALQCSKGTVQNVRHRCLDEGLEASLVEKPRPGASTRPKITGEIEAQLIAAACSAAPQGRTRWTLKLLADRLVELQLVQSVSCDTVHRVLKRGR
jgi:putative transposase